jgi:transposase InsO family protein
VRILGLVADAVEAGARQQPACELIGLSDRTLERWREQDTGDDRRHGPKTTPGNKLSEVERKRVLEVVNSPEYRSLSPKQIVPRLADQGTYIASESSMYRILAAAGQNAHREPSKPRKRHKPSEYVAHGPLEVFTWDITYLRSAVRGEFYYLYLVVDIWSRKIVGWRVERTESMDYSAELIKAICDELGVDPEGIVLHSDNGGPMKGSTMLATLQLLGIVASFSRPRVSDDNPYSEALFRTLKYRPWYPSRPFKSLEEARAWVTAFVDWYNDEHLHSAVGYVTPNDRHAGQDVEILAQRHNVYEEAKRRHPERWSGATRNWSRVEVVKLNPDAETNHADEDYDAAA